MKKLTAAALAVFAAALLNGCDISEETYQPEKYVIAEAKQSRDSSDGVISPEIESGSDSSAASSSARQGASSTKRSTAPVGSAKSASASSLKKKAPAAPVIRDNETAYILKDVYLGGKSRYAVISGQKCVSENPNALKIGDTLYENFAISLYDGGKRVDRLKLDVPSGERFIILENAAEGLSYGCDVISNKKLFGAEEYPDIIGLVFQGEAEGEDEAAVPVYERFFSVFDGKLTELPIYEDGCEVRPRGAKLEPKSAGLTVQHLTVPSGDGYRIVKYEYTFDVENRRLNKRQVRFYGWDY